MNGAIELPGEAAPLTPQQVYLALQSATSYQQHRIQTGTQQLQTWESQSGYYSILQVDFYDLQLRLFTNLNFFSKPSLTDHFLLRFDILL